MPHLDTPVPTHTYLPPPTHTNTHMYTHTQDSTQEEYSTHNTYDYDTNLRHLTSKRLLFILNNLKRSGGGP